MDELKIVRLLEKKRDGLTINEVAELLGINRITASKYLAILEAKGRLVVRPIGKAKLYYSKRGVSR